MKKNEKLNVIMLAAAGLILVAVNAGVWMTARNGSIPAVGNTTLWSVFVVLNIVSILWAVTLLGLQPLVAAVSYAAGGTIAFLGVRSMDGVNVAEITTAGATYGAFGALAVSNAMVKMRLAFFRKAQVPFVFIILGLLVLDAVLNSRISHADGRAYLNAVVFPLVFGGVSVGLIWSLIARVALGGKPSAAATEAVARQSKSEKQAESGKLTIEIPQEKAAEPVRKEPVRVAEPAPKAKPVVQPQPVVAEKESEPVVEDAPQDEAFFPLEIDKDEEFEPKQAPAAMQDEEEDDDFVLPAFDAGLYSAGSMEHDRSGGVAVEEPQVSVSVEAERKEEPEPVAEAEPEPAEEKKPEKENKNDDWLGGHMDLLNKLK